MLEINTLMNKCSICKKNLINKKVYIGYGYGFCSEKHRSEFERKNQDLVKKYLQQIFD